MVQTLFCSPVAVGKAIESVISLFRKVRSKIKSGRFLFGMSGGLKSMKLILFFISNVPRAEDSEIFFYTSFYFNPSFTYDVFFIQIFPFTSAPFFSRCSFCRKRQYIFPQNNLIGPSWILVCRKHW